MCETPDKIFLQSRTRLTHVSKKKAFIQMSHKCTSSITNTLHINMSLISSLYTTQDVVGMRSFTELTVRNLPQSQCNNCRAEHAINEVQLQSSRSLHIVLQTNILLLISLNNTTTHKSSMELRSECCTHSQW